MSGADNNIHLQEQTLFDPDDDPDFNIFTEKLERVDPKQSTSEDSGSSGQPQGPTSDPYGEGGDPGLVGLVETFAPGYRDLHVPPRIEPPVRYNDRHGDTVMHDRTEVSEAPKKPDTEIKEDPSETAFEAKLKGVAVNNLVGNLNPNELQETATASLAHAAAAKGHDEGGGGSLDERHDSHQEQDPPIPPDKADIDTCVDSSALQLDTRRESAAEESIATSPTLSKHVITMRNDDPETLPAFQHHSPVGEGNASPPKGATLPPIHQIVTQPLQELAELATQNDHRTAHFHSPTFGSATSQSSGIPYHPYPGSAHLSPSSQHPYSARSPTSIFSEAYGSPTQHAQAYYTSRRSSAPVDRNLGPPPSIPSVSSSGDSRGHASSIDGYSTAQTTPIDPAEATPRPILPPPPGMVVPGYKCDVPNCPAPPFQTQYLLSSHKNVHTNLRPHYCPVKDCPRSEGGKGFKRKNEMIRHGLVHESPGYVCPFCPDREHRYPRPDNLQRHVRVHHVDKDRDDPELRAVLAQRPQGTRKPRRQRANTGGSGT